ncbi:hypothetical protein F4804DRAFT_304381 [Jackrogersella minutella]|nr:hypothetical protein F4804DRAFT_304381 [Jackrogersella minutella]
MIAQWLPNFILGLPSVTGASLCNATVSNGKKLARLVKWRPSGIDIRNRGWQKTSTDECVIRVSVLFGACSGIEGVYYDRSYCCFNSSTVTALKRVETS